MLSEIGQVIGVDNSAVTGLADRMEKAGYVTREPSPGDTRGPGTSTSRRKAGARLKRHPLSSVG